MTNTREEVAVAEAIYYATGDMPRAIPFEQSCEEALICRKQAKAAIAASNSKYIAGLVEALKAQTDIIREIEMGLTPKSLTVARFGDVMKARISGEIALNNLPQELRG